MLDFHNKNRAAEGSSNMIKLRWNDQLAELAQKFANKCEYGHATQQQRANIPKTSDPNGERFNNLGENILWNAMPMDFPMTVSDMAQPWQDERKDYVYNSASCAGNEVCSHYTQIVWADTSEIGMTSLLFPCLDNIGP